MATAAFTGLRRSEIRGLRWEDYIPGEAGELGEVHVEQSIWRKHVQVTKTRRSRAAVLVVPALENILAEFRAARGNPQTGYIFEGARNRGPFDLDGLAKRYIEPVEESALALVASVSARPRDQSPSSRRGR